MGELADADWFPLVMVIVIGAVMYLLYLSMRHEIGKISIPPRTPKSPDDVDQR